MKYILTILAFCFCMGLSKGQSCEIDGIFHSTFEDVKLILDSNNCASCHGNQNNLGSWNYDTYDSFLSSGNCNKTMILHGDASNSYFFRKLSGGSEICEESNDNIHNLTIEQSSQIESWINFGAPELCIPLYQDVRMILDDNNCNSCHGNDAQAWRYDTYGNMLNNNLDGNCSEERVIIKGNSINSLLYDKINNDGFVACGDEMISEFGPMSSIDVAHIRDWINSGAFETSSSLPVILTNFSVIDDYEVIRLNWSTEVEIATDKFVIERSITGQDFEKILEVKSEGGATHGFDYSIEDSTPSIGDNYYRLKIVDLDGSYNYSNIRLARVKSGKTVVTVYPNPAVSLERLTVKWLPTLDEESTYLNIVDVNGQNLHRKIIFEGTNYVRLPRLLDGVYYIIVEDLFGGFILERVVIIN
jgi:hypothetical protein